MGILTASTGNVTRQFGTFSCEIQLDSDNITTASKTIKLATMPKLTQDFELQDELNDLSELRVNLSEITINVFDGLGDGTNLFNYINSMELTDTITVKVVVNSGTDYFVSRKENCNYDWQSRKISFKAQSAVKYDVEVTDYTTNIADYTSPEDFVTSKDLITAFLESQGDNPTVTVKGHMFTHGVSDITGQPIGSPRYMIFEETYVSDYQKAQDIVLGFSFIEGAIMGAMLGEAFYVRRNYAGEILNDDYVSISASDLKSFGVDFNKRSVRNFNTSFFIQDNLGTGTETDIGRNEDEVISSRGNQDIDILYRVDNMNTIEYSSGWQLQNGGTSVLTSSDMLTTSNNARAGYKAALGISSSYSVKFELFGITSLKPYQYILFGSGIHETINGKKVRPSYIEYDLENDIVKGEGYIIG